VGTRITLYAILDYVHAGWPPKLIQEWFNLTDTQIEDVFSYLAAHRDEVEQEYQQVIQQAEETRRYWEERNRNRVVQSPPASTSSEQTALREKLRAWKDKIGLK
jgi:hypothetical protein